MQRLETCRQWWKWHWKTIALVLVAFVGIWLLFGLIVEIVLGTAESATFVYVFRVLTTEGGVNTWLARAVTVLFVVATSCGLRLLLKKKRRIAGWLVLAGTFVAFNLLMYACTQSMSGVKDKRLINPVGKSDVYYCITPDGGWELFEHPGYSPDRQNFGPEGQELKVMSPEAAQRYEAWKRSKAAGSDKQNKAEAQRRFRETYLNDRVLASGPPAAQVLLCVKTEGPDSPSDFLQGQISNLLAKKRNPVSGVFKPAFYADGAFDGLWNGDQSVVERLRLFEGSARCLLLAKASFSQPDKTDFDGVVSVQGRLTILLLNKEGRTGSWTFNASGAGNNPTTAMEACAKRLVEAIDLGTVFSN